MNETPEFVHEVDLGRVSWALWASVGVITLTTGGLWLGVILAIRSPQSDPSTQLLVLVGGLVFQLLLVAIVGLLLTDARLRAGVFRVELKGDQLGVTSPPALGGWSFWDQSFAVPLAQIERLIIDRYSLDVGDVSYSIRRDDGKLLRLDLPQGNGEVVWPLLFAAILRLRPTITVDDWTHTRQGRVRTEDFPPDQRAR